VGGVAGGKGVGLSGLSTPQLCYIIWYVVLYSIRPTQ